MCGNAADASDRELRESCGERHGTLKLRAEGKVIVRSIGAREEHLRGKRGAVQSDGDAVACEGRDHGGLIAKTPKVALFASEIAIGDGRDGERARPERFGAFEKLLQMAITLKDCGEKFRPDTEAAQGGAADDKTEIGDVVFDEREAAIAAGEEIEIHVAM